MSEVKIEITEIVPAYAEIKNHYIIEVYINGELKHKRMAMHPEEAGQIALHYETYYKYFKETIVSLT